MSEYAHRLFDVFALPTVQNAPHVCISAWPENHCLLVEPVTGWYSETTGGYITRAFGAYSIDLPKERKRQ